VLLGAHAHGFAGYWRTPGVLREQAGRDAVGLSEGEHFVGLLHLGYPVQQQQRVPERPATTETTIYLD
jgi:nitroreductase